MPFSALSASRRSPTFYRDTGSIHRSTGFCLSTLHTTAIVTAFLGTSLLILQWDIYHFVFTVLKALMFFLM